MTARLLAAAVLVLAVGGMPQALGQGKPASSSNQGVTNMDEFDMGSLETEKGEAPEMPDERPAFIRDSRFGGQLRSFYFNEDKFNHSRSEAWTAGGSLAYRSGYVADILRIGAVAYTSQHLWAPQCCDGTQLLQTGQKAYTVLGQAYGELRLGDRIFGSFGRKEYSTPYLSGDDSRMTPNTFQGVSAYGSAGGKDGEPLWQFGGGYLSKIKQRNSEDFIPMSAAAGAKVNRGLYIAGAKFEYKGFSLGASNYYSADVINIFYTEARYRMQLAEGNTFTVRGQFTDQRSTGDNMLTGRSFSTHQGGIKADLSHGAALLTLGYTKNANGANLQTPWSAYPGYTNSQVEEYSTAGESAAMVRAAYDFSKLGARDVSAYALLVVGSGIKAPSFNNNELDFNLQWAPRDGAWRGLSLRLRYAYVKQQGGGNPDINELRLIMNYDFPAR